MSIILRPYQEEIISDLRSLMKKGSRSNLVVSATGSGKTALASHMLKSASQRGMVSWFVVHRKELIEQSAFAFNKVGVKFGIISPHFYPDYRCRVQIASIQTLANRLHLLPPPSMIVWDECHHIASKSWSKVFDKYPKAFHVGLTATPQRLDGKGLDSWFKNIVEGPTVSWLIENGFLSQYSVFVPRGGSVETKGIKKSMGDFARGELSDLMDKPHITGDAVKEYIDKCFGKRAIAFCTSVEHSEHVVAAFKKAGIPALHIDANTPSHIREQSKKDFQAGKVKVLSNVDLFGEGYDVPALEAVLLLRPTQSLGLYLQQVGRVLRPMDGKEKAIILDHAGNVARHGLPDEEREWSLYSSKKSKEDAGESVKICKVCFAAVQSFKAVCPECGNKFQGAPRADVKQVEGDLVELNKEDIKRASAQEQVKAQSLEDLYQLGLKRGYKHARKWAQHVFQSRQAKRLKGRL